jgi:type VI protein secretion system component Hcp
MGNQRQPRSDKERARTRHPQVSATDDWRSDSSTTALSPNGIVQLQRTVGNQAVQRLLSREVLHDSGNVAVQRDTPGGGTREAASLAAWVATLTGDEDETFKGNSRIPGHEGKIEFLSLSLPVEKPSSRQAPDDTKSTQITLSRHVDELSPGFNRAVLDGKPVKTAKFESIKRDTDGKITVVTTLNFSEGNFAGYQMSGGGDEPVEQIELDFKKGPS